MVIKDVDGNDHEAGIGSLVSERHYDDLGYPFGRVTAIGNDCLYVRRCAHEGATRYYPDMVFWVSDDPPEQVKEPSLAERRKGLIDNLDSAMCRLSQLGDSDDYELIRLLRQKLRYPDDEHSWWWGGIAESCDDPRQISYAPEPKYFDNDTRRRKCRIGRFLSGPAKERGLSFTRAEIARISNIFGQHFPDSRDYTFEIVRGSGAVFDAYATEENQIWGSCMYRKPYVRWYGENEGKCGVIKIMQGDIYAGRALIWHTDQGVTVVDRVYPSNNGPHTNALHRWCEANGYDYKTSQSCCDGYLKSGRHDYTVTMRRSQSGDYPYCDTFKYTNDNPEECDTLVVNVSVGDYSFRETDGGYEGGPGRHYCEECDCRLDEDEGYAHDGSLYCQSCFYDRFVELDYRRPNGRCGEWVNRTIHRDDAAYCEECCEYRLPEDMVEVRGRTGSGRRVTDDICVCCAADTAHECCDCGDTWRDDETITTDGGDTYCPDCWENVGATCEECGAAGLSADFFEKDGDLYCGRCAPEDATPTSDRVADPLSIKEPRPETTAAAPVEIDTSRLTYPVDGAWMVNGNDPSYPDPCESFNYLTYDCTCQVCCAIKARRTWEFDYTRDFQQRCACYWCRQIADQRQAYINAPYPNTSEQRVLNERAARDRAIIVSTPPSTAWTTNTEAAAETLTFESLQEAYVQALAAIR